MKIFCLCSTVLTLWLALVAGNILYTCYTRTIYKYLVVHLLSTFSDLFQTLSIQPRQPDLVAVLRKFQNVPYNARDIFVKDLCKCSNAFAKLKRYVPSSSPVFHFLHFLIERRMKNNVEKHLTNIKKKKKKCKRKRSSVVPCGFRVACVFPHIDRVSLRRRIREFC